MDTSPTNTGASNAEDFQPPTQNPQVAPGQVFPQQDTVQEGAMTRLLENSNAKIQVPVNPAPARPQIAEAKPGYGTFLIAAILLGIVLVSLHLWRRRKILPTSSTPAVSPPENVVVSVSDAPSQPARVKSADPKRKAARKAAKRRKRSRR